MTHLSLRRGILAAIFWSMFFANAATLLAQTETPERSASGAITLSQCRIQLIDRRTLATDRPGVIGFIDAVEGERVKQDQLVAGLRDEVLKAALAVTAKQKLNTVDIEYSKAAFDVAQIDVEKAVQANQGRKGTIAIIPEIEIRKLKLTAERSRLAIEQAQNEFDIAALRHAQSEAELKNCYMEAPFDGLITRIYKFPGEAVGMGDPVVDLVNTDRVRIEGDLPIADVWRLKPGAAVTVQLDIKDVDLPVERERFEGSIVFVDVVVEALSRTVRVWAEVANRDNTLREGLYATMTIDPESQGRRPEPPLGARVVSPRAVEGAASRDLRSTLPADR